MTTIHTSTGGYSTAGWGHTVTAPGSLVDVATDLCGTLSPAEKRVLSDVGSDPEASQADVVAALAGILADHRSVDVEDVEDEVEDFLDGYNG